MKILDYEKQEKVKTALVSRKFIEWVAHTFEVSEHAEFRMVERDKYVNRDLRKSILNSPLAWKSIEENRVFIALDLYNYIVVHTDREKGKPIIITFATTKDKDTTVEVKYQVDYKKYMRGGK